MGHMKPAEKSSLACSSGAANLRMIVAAAGVMLFAVLFVTRFVLSFETEQNSESGSVPVDAMSNIGNLTEMRRVCLDWADDGTTIPESGPVGSSPVVWCRDMIAWMDRQMVEGDVTGPMMWDSPEKVRGTCHRWVEGIPEGVPGDGPGHGHSAWCDDMTAWMSDHMDWGHHREDRGGHRMNDRTRQQMHK